MFLDLMFFKEKFWLFMQAYAHVGSKGIILLSMHTSTIIPEVKYIVCDLFTVITFFQIFCLCS